MTFAVPGQCPQPQPESRVEIERLARQAPDLARRWRSRWPTMPGDLLGLPAGAGAAQERAGRWGAQAISGLVETGETTPYQNWLRRVAAHLDNVDRWQPRSCHGQITPRARTALRRCVQLVPSIELPAGLAQRLVAVVARRSVVYGFLTGARRRHQRTGSFSCSTRRSHATRHSQPEPARMKSGCTPGRCFPVPLRKSAGCRRWRTRWIAVAAALLLAFLLIPVRQSVLAPAEIISLESVVLASPVEGVVREVLVRPEPGQWWPTSRWWRSTTPRCATAARCLLKSVGSVQAELLATTAKIIRQPAKPRRDRAAVGPRRGTPCRAGLHRRAARPDGRCPRRRPASRCSATRTTGAEDRSRPASG